MIRIKKEPCPRELTKDKQKKLTIEYIQSKKQGKEKKVWKKKYIILALCKSSHNKCCYCECKLGEEGKYLAVEHFYPKTHYPQKVIEWKNLLPSCGRCNSYKSDLDPNQEPMINPSTTSPREYLVMHDYRLYPKEGNATGKNTIDILQLNDRAGLVNPRSHIGAGTHDQIEKLLEDIVRYDKDVSCQSLREKNKIQGRTLNLLQEACPEAEYSATVATVLSKSPDFRELQNLLKKHKLWNKNISNLYRKIQKSHLNNTSFSGRSNENLRV